MNNGDLAGLTILGALVSLALEGIKNLWGDTFWSRWATLGLALGGATLYYFVRQNTVLYQNVILVLGAASTFYGFILAKKPSVGTP